MKTGQCNIGELVTRSRLRWLGHVARMGEERPPPKLLYGSGGHGEEREASREVERHD